jgi:dihydrofolate synthase/folylpolyglutamate synthase
VTRGASPRTLADWLAQLEGAHPKAIDMTLERAQRVWDRLKVRFKASVVVVAGTNGKGSTCAMMDSIAREAGLRVGLYSKPHLVHFEERCRVNGIMVKGDALLPHFEAVEQARDQTTLTYFEHTTLAIMRLLSQIRLDLVILEVGLGGRLDAVNVVDADCAVITGIDIDHTAYLGNDREAIGREKAGIFRKGRPAVVGDLSPPASILAYAHELSAPLSLAGRDFRVAKQSARHWSWEGSTERHENLPLPALKGAFQVRNASTALAALAALPLPRFEFTEVAAGLQNVQLAGRFQLLPGEPQLVLDVAHNRDAASALAASLRTLPCWGRTFAVFGCMSDKQILEIVDEMRTVIDGWYVTNLPVVRAASAAELQRIIATVPCQQASAWLSVEEALQAARQAARAWDRIVVFGSFHMVGAVLNQLGLEESRQAPQAAGFSTNSY